MVHETLSLNCSSLPELTSSTNSRSQTGWEACRELKFFFISRPNLWRLDHPLKLLAAFIPARFHQQLQLPQAAHTPRSPAGPEKQNLDRKLGQRWVLPQYRTVPIPMWLKTDLERVKNLAYLDCSKEENSSSDVYRHGHEEESKPFDFLTSGSGSDSLINCPRSLTRPNVIFLKGGWVKALWKALSRENKKATTIQTLVSEDQCSTSYHLCLPKSIRLGKISSSSHASEFKVYLNNSCRQ